MLAQIVSTLLNKEDDFEVVCQSGERTDLKTLVEHTRTDVVILGSRGREAPAAVTELLLEHPRLKLFIITPNGRDAFRVELKPQSVPIKEISSRRLVDEIRAALGPARPDNFAEGTP